MEMNGTLYFYFFQAGANPLEFQPNTMWSKQYLGTTGNWSEEKPWGHIGEVAWQYQKENGTAYTVSYSGLSSYLTLGGISLMLNKSSDGVNYDSYNPSTPV